MSVLQCISEEDGELVFSVSSGGPEVERLISAARRACSPSVRNLTWNEVLTVVEFALAEVVPAAIHKARWIQQNIDSGEFDKDESAIFASSPGACRDLYGDVQLLLDYSSSEDFAGRLEEFDIPVQLGLSNILAGFALFQLDNSLLSLAEANTFNAMNYLASAGEALRLSSFFDGFDAAWGELARGDADQGTEGQDVVKTEAAADVARDFFSRLGKAGAAKRHSKTGELKAWAIERFKAGGTWTANKAAHELMDSVIAHGRTIGVPLSKENAQRTIATWFRKSV